MKQLIRSFSIGAIHIAAGDIEALVHFYTNTVGMDILARTDNTVSLGEVNKAYDLFYRQ